MKTGEVFVVALLGAVAGISLLAREPLPFGERVMAQEALERVTYAHRIWPKENAQTKPPFEEMVSRAVLEAKVADILRKSGALGEFWQRPIKPEQLQAEMDRMAQDTKDPAMLREYFAALGDDPYLIAECLARHLLAERLLQNWYAGDDRFHGGAKAQAQTALEAARAGESLESICGGEVHRILTRYRPEGAEASRDETAPGEISVESEDEWRQIQESWPLDGPTARLSDLREAYVVQRLLRRTADLLETEEAIFAKEPLKSWLDRHPELAAKASPSDAAEFSFTLPSLARRDEDTCNNSWVRSSLNEVTDGRQNHAAVWTGTEMIIWGGYVSNGGGFSVYLNTGGRYNPATDTWIATPLGSGCPTPRKVPAIWTGTEMIVWGGYDSSGRTNTGGRYNPTTDIWLATSTGANCPTARSSHTAVWAGTEMMIWGGGDDSSLLNTGGRYNPASDSWVATSTGANCPLARAGHTAVWTGSEMVVWGGLKLVSPREVNSGGRYNPVTDSWVPTSQGAGCPVARSQHTTIWTGTRMIVWGGLDTTSSTYFNSGGIYDPAADSWVPTSTGSGCPAGRNGHSAVWTGEAMVVWGGLSGSWGHFGDGGRLDPGTNTWAAVSTGTNCPLARAWHTAVWTGSEMLIWGGYYGFYAERGARYAPATDSWLPMAISTTAPAARFEHTAVWTGSEMIVWGGMWLGSGWFPLNSGGRYFPATDSWAPTGAGDGLPAARTWHSAIWTGSEMIVWGGEGTYPAFNTGGRYSPVSDMWTATSTGSNCPSARTQHSAVWTGSEMIVWGGWNGTTALNTGAQYSPASDGWTSISATSSTPSTRYGHTAAWTGTEMVIWGGAHNSTATNTGGRYGPSTNTWQATITGTNCPTGRNGHTAVWTGTEMVVWGGRSDLGDLATGGRYSVDTDTWNATSVGAFCPTARYSHSAVWTGTEMIIWGGGPTNGYTNTGGRYLPASDTWTVTSVGSDCPIARSRHTAIWTGTQMIVWGGYTATGGIFCGSPPSCSLSCDASASPSSGSKPLVVSFTATATPSGCTGDPIFYWTFGDGGESTQQNPSHMYASVGTYPWTMMATADDTTCLKTGSIVVSSPCSLTCMATAAPSSGTAPLVVSFAATATPSNCTGSPAFSWAFGDGGVSAQQNPTHTYESAGTYTWTMTVTAESVTCTKTGTITVSAPCALSCTATASPSSGTAPLAVDFTATATPSNCTGVPTCFWAFGDGGTSAQQNPTHTYATAGTYAWTMIATADGRTCTWTGTITVSASPCWLTCEASAMPSSGIAPLAVAFVATATPSNCIGAPTFSWAFGDGGTSTEQNPSHTFASSGMYAWTMTVTTDDVPCTKAGTITVSSTICALSCTAAATPSSGAAPLTMNFSASATPSNCTGTPTFSWTFGDSETSSQKNPSHTYAAAGTYMWTMTSTLGEAACSKTGTVTVSPPPACTLSCTASASPSSGTAPLAVVFTATATPSNCSGETLFLWTFGDGGTSPQQNPVHTYISDGTFTWTMTATVVGVTCTRMGTVTATQAPPCTLSCTASASPSSGTAPLAVTFSAAATTVDCAGAPTFSWTFGDGGTSPQRDTGHTYATAGTYTWTMTATADGATCTRTGLVTATQAPSCTLSCSATASPSSGTAPLLVAFLASATAVDCTEAPAFSWNFGDGSTSSHEDPSHLYAGSGTFSWSLTVTVGAYTCTQAGEVVAGAPCTVTCEASATPGQGTAPLEVAFAGSAAASNCSGEPSYLWTFGDGGTSTGADPTHTYSGAGAYDWTMTATVQGVTCSKAGTLVVASGLPGDGDGDGVVSIGEVQQAINMFLGLIPPGNGADCDEDGAVSIGEVQKVINAFLGLPSAC